MAGNVSVALAMHQTSVVYPPAGSQHKEGYTPRGVYMERCRPYLSLWVFRGRCSGEGKCPYTSARDAEESAMLTSLIVGVTTTVCRRSSRGAALPLSLLLMLGSRSIVRDRLDNNGFSTGNESRREPQRDISRRKFVRHT